VITHLLPKVGQIIIGGGMAFTFFKAMGLEVGSSPGGGGQVDFARELLATARTKSFSRETF